MASTDQEGEVLVQLQPHDSHNRLLELNVHPRDWKNQTPKDSYHLVVIGAGTAGLVTAAGAAGLGARVALIERELMGGDCLNVGCVPSKGVIRSARVAATVREAATFGVNVPDGVAVDFGKAMERMRAIRASISKADAAKRFSELGVDVFFGNARFENDGTVSVRARDGMVTRFPYKKAVIASGARASAPPIEGLDSVDYLTNESLFSLTEVPRRLGVVGSGPIGAEMSQAFQRLGSEVYLFERGEQILAREDPGAAAVVQKQLVNDGVQLVLNAKEMQLSPANEDSVSVRVEQNGELKAFTVDKLLIAVGRAPNVDDLNLEAVGVDYDNKGVKVNDRLQTSNASIFAAGDVCTKYRFTHVADFQARIVIQNALFAIGPFGIKKSSDLVIPWTTYTSPEIAHVGMYPKDAKDKGIEIDTYTQQLDEVDRAVLEGSDAGFVRVHTKKGTDKIVGATIVAENAGDLISEVTLAMTHGMGLGKLASTIHPYPTQAEAIRKLGDQFSKTKLTSTAKAILGALMRFNVGT
jgi:pyruvate/2-oxoglutarate dehydrogenase complex dihydrolipoamide dehydrogenase (E3) component